MRLPTVIIVFIVLIWTFIYTISYGIFVWRQKNRLGAAAVMLLALAALLLPVLTILIRG